MRSVIMAAIAMAIVSVAAESARAIDPAVRCEAQKLKAAGDYADCRLMAQQQAIMRGKPVDFAKCEENFSKAWQRIEERDGMACPTLMDEIAVEGAVKECTDTVAMALSGAGFPPPVCQQFPATGQTTAYTADKNDGIAGPVAVPDDGTVQAGATLRYIDNGDGTITDNNTGLMWEKKSSDFGLHDWRQLLQWSGNGSQETIWDWLDDINSEGGTGFAGHNDWRIPNIRELLSIVDYGRLNPSLDPIFKTACEEGCTVTTCSCTASVYWSSTSYAFDPENDAWIVLFNVGVSISIKDWSGSDKKGVCDPFRGSCITDRLFVRAVRGGS